ncbi:MAG: DUF4382 domain-containing protein [Chloroflexi bacterium]|nr:DUF4382 domain-containing protein [Chloroflexota bacterium]
MAVTLVASACATASTLEVRISRDSVPSVSKLLVTAKDLQAHRAEAAQDEWETVVSGEFSFDLAGSDAAGGRTLGKHDVPSGDYTQVRMTLEHVTVGGVNGRETEAFVADRTVTILGTFTVASGGTTVITLDFDPERSLSAGDGGVRQFRPLIRLIGR